MRFKTIDEIIEVFDLKSNQIPQIRKELRELLKNVHSGSNPDGKFSNKDDELTYHKIMDALTFLKSESLSISNKQLSHTINEIVPYSMSLKKTKKLEKQFKAEIRSLKKSSIFPRVSTSALTIILTFIWFTPSEISDHPILANIFSPSDVTFKRIWIASIVLTSLIWLITWRKEKTMKAGIKKLSLESFQNSILGKFIESKEKKAKQDKKRFIIFTKDEIVEHFSCINIRTMELAYSYNKRTNSWLKRFLGFNQTIDTDIAQNLTEIILGRLLSRKTIKVIETGSLSITFRKEIRKKEA